MNRKFGLKKETIEKIINVFKSDKKIEKVIIYGSRAKGNYKNGSDIDLTLITENLELKDLNSIQNQLDDLMLPYSFDISIYNHIKNEDLLDHIKRVGQIFYKKAA